MTVKWADWTVTAGLVAAGFAVSHALLRRRERTVAELQRIDLERQLGELTATVEALQKKVEALRRGPELEAAAIAAEFEMAEAPVAAMDSVPVVVEHATEFADEEVTPETMKVIGAAVEAFLGKKVRVLSAKRVEKPYERKSRWSQQGRVLVQASHNLRIG